MSYAEDAADVLEMLTEDGVSLTFSHKTLASESNGSPTWNTPTTTIGKSLICDPSDGKGFGSAWGKSYEEASRVTTEKRFLWVAASGMTFAPGPGDTTTFESKTWSVLGRYKLCPDGATDILYGMGVAQV